MFKNNIRKVTKANDRKPEQGELNLNEMPPQKGQNRTVNIHKERIINWTQEKHPRQEVNQTTKQETTTEGVKHKTFENQPSRATVKESTDNRTPKLMCQSYRTLIFTAPPCHD